MEMTRDPTGILGVSSGDIERGGVGLDAPGDSYDEEQPELNRKHPTDSYQLVDLDKTILSSFGCDEEQRNRADVSGAVQDHLSQQDRAEKNEALFKTQVIPISAAVPGAVSKKTPPLGAEMKGAGPSFKDQVRSQNDVQQQKQAVGPGFKDQVRSDSPHFHRSGRAPDQEENLSAEPDANPSSGPALISAHVVEERDTLNDMVQAEAMPGGIFLNRRVLVSMIAALLMVGSIVGGVCGGTGACRSSSDPVSAIVTAPPTTLAPTTPPTPAPTLSIKSLEILEYINSTRFSSDPIVLPIVGNRNATPEELALDWLMHGDPLELSVDSDNDRFRLRQRYALLTFYFATNGPSWTQNDNWLVKNDECTWYGITCSDGVVSSIGSDGFDADDVLGGNALKGFIHADIALLEAVTEINFYANPELKGSMPSSIGNLRQLQWLKVDSCGIEGSLPTSMGDLSNLSVFRINANAFTGPLPSSISSWKNIEWFDVSTALDDGVISLSLSPFLSFPPHARFNQLMFCR